MATIQDIKQHYDAHHAVILEVLDPETLSYSCGHWTPGIDANAAQRAKFDYIADKIDLRNNRKILEIGSGWGSFARYCRRFHPSVEIHGLTLSPSQKVFVDEQRLGNVEITLKDWKEFEPSITYDAIVSIESFEHYASMDDRRHGWHIGIYRDFFARCAQWTVPTAPLYVQSSIARRQPGDFQGVMDARFIVEKVFTGSALPTISNLQEATLPLYEFEELRLRGQEMACTVEDWGHRLSAKAEELRSAHGPEMVAFFERYFAAASRCFRRGDTDLIQLVLRKTRLN
jgi:cyclopropane-fatty-acyl-phospholipid synthase